ncbi:hypothetical protein J4558_13850 [Leptolyngbya sp. 15MV]|nr:hypothetical protein J4558_13850 [Leptolyngbya sp. 15MV]
MMAPAAESIVVTGQRVERKMLDASSPVAVVAGEEQLGDLKLYRVPEPVTVAAKAMKQVAFLDRQSVEARLLYRVDCTPYGRFGGADGHGPAAMLLVTRNERGKGLGIALPQGGMAVFEPSAFGPQLVAEPDLRDYAVGQDIELALGTSTQVHARCAYAGPGEPPGEGPAWRAMRAEIANANPHPIAMRIDLGEAGQWEARWPRRTARLKDGRLVVELEIPANSIRTFDWRLRETL